MALTVTTLQQIEVWTTYACAGGTRVGIVEDPLSCTATETVEGDDLLDLTVRLNSTAAALLLEQYVLRLWTSDSVWDEWRIIEVIRNAEQERLTVKAVSPLAELADSGLVSQTEGGVVTYHFEILGRTPTEILTTYALPAAPVWVSLGTIDSSEILEMAVGAFSALRLVRAVAEAAKLEVECVRNGTTGYVLHLRTALGSSANVADLRYQKNLLGSSQRRSAIEQATVVVPIGADEGDGQRATMGEARWEITNIAATVLTLADPADGAGPVGFDDQLNGLYLEREDGSARTQITDSAAGAQTVTVASAAGFSVGDLVAVRADSAGTRLTRLTHPTALATYGTRVRVVERSDLPGHANLVPNPFMRAWPGSLPTGWQAVGSPTTTKQTTGPYTRLGGASIRVLTSASGAGVRTPLASFTPGTTGDRLYISAYARLWVVSGAVRVELVGSDASVWPPAAQKAVVSVRGQFVDLGVAGIEATGLTGAYLRIVQDGNTAAEFYVDAAQLTQTAGQRELVEGSGGTKLWQAANEYLLERSAPSVETALGVLDLARVYPSAWGLDSTLVLGGNVRVTDERLLASGTARVVEIQRDYLEPARTSVVLSTKFKNLSGTLAAPALEPRQAVEVGVQSSLAGITPVLDLTPLAENYNPVHDGATYCKWAIAATAGGGSTGAVTLTVFQTGAAMDRWTGSAWTPLTSGSTVTSGAVVRVLRPPYGQPVGTLLVTATQAGGGTATLQRTIPTQERDATSAAAATITLETPVAQTDRVSLPFSWPSTSTAIRARLWVQEHTTDPTQVDVDGLGWVPAGSPLVKGDGRTFLVIPVAQPGTWLLITAVPYDSLGRSGTKVTVKVAVPGSPPSLPADVTAAPTLQTNGSTSQVLRVTMPSNIANFTLIRVYRNGAPWQDFTRTAGANATQDITVTGLSPGTAYVWTVFGYGATGQSVNPSPGLTATTQAATIPTPWLTYSHLDNGYTAWFVITPGNDTPEGVTWELQFEEQDQPGTWAVVDENTSTLVGGFVPATDTFWEARVRGTKQGWTSSGWSNVVQFSRSTELAP